MDGDFDDEEVVKRMCVGAAFSVMVIIFTFLGSIKRPRRSIRSGPSEENLRREKTRADLMRRIFHGYSDSCQNFVRMRSAAFMKLASLMRKLDLLKDSRNVTVEKQLAITLNILGHKSKNRTMRTQFIRSGDTVKKYYLCDAGYTTQPGFISPYRGVRYHLKEFTGRTPQNRRELFNLRHSSLRSKIEATFGILKNRFKILTSKPHYPFPAQVDIVLACTVLHNYIATVDPEDELLNETTDIEEEDGEEEINEESNVMDFTQSQTVREQNASKDEWRSRRDQIALDMWIDYCSKYRHGDTHESAL
ncbi:uncharacterized protein LOC109847609 [Asparagus officinalis]|uniref:uncharacterized protein LOC109847609 n=1 Tax=Asparagus officinalis TaxID=4686 RepID=UPI00098DE7ED|nr:uncharacterized protein LOC109847609 [Asparagus officinalis]